MLNIVANCETSCTHKHTYTYNVQIYTVRSTHSTIHTPHTTYTQTHTCCTYFQYRNTPISYKDTTKNFSAYQPCSLGPCRYKDTPECHSLSNYWEPSRVWHYVDHMWGLRGKFDRLTVIETSRQTQKIAQALCIYARGVTTNSLGPSYNSLVELVARVDSGCFLVR